MIKTPEKIIPSPQLGILLSFFWKFFNPQLGQFQKIPTPPIKVGGQNYMHPPLTIFCRKAVKTEAFQLHHLKKHKCLYKKQ